MKGYKTEYRPKGQSTNPQTWHLFFDLPRDGAGRQRKCVTFYGGTRAADKELSRLITEASSGGILPTNKTTVEQYLSGWLERRASDGLSPVTLQTWGYLATAYIYPHIGKLSLAKLSEARVEALYVTLRTTGRRKGSGGISPRSVQHVHRLLSEVMKSAVRVKLIPSNPCEPVAPRMEEEQRSVTEVQRIQALLRGGGLQRLLNATEGTWLHVPVLLALFLGLRRGEVLGLRWEDVDLKAGTLRVEQTLQCLRGSGLVFKAPKSKTGRRTVGIPDFLGDELRKLKGVQAAHRLQMGPEWQDAGLVIQKDDTGGPRLPDNLTHGFAKVAERIGMGELHFHDLRHGNATLLKLSGVSTKVISARLGHSDTQITRDLYEHVMPEQDTEAANRTDRFFRDAMGA